MAATPDIPGHQIADVIGTGGFATVYRGWQVAVGREVAVKVDNRVLASDRDRRRFVREVTAAGRLSGHPHVIDIYDAGTLDGGRPYMVMEFCPGGSLADAVRRDGVMRPAQVRDIGIKIADALAAAHAAGVLHRDVKPANILVNQYGIVGLSDFGLASILAAEGDQSVTREAFTPAFASPESFHGHEPTVAGDLYSLAATLYDLLAGRPPRFPADGRGLSVAMLVSLHRMPVDDIPGVPPVLMDTLRMGLAADPAVRPRSAAAFRDALIAAPESQARPMQSWPAQSAHAASAPARSRQESERGHLTLTMPPADRTAGEPAAGNTVLVSSAARHARRRSPAEVERGDGTPSRRRYKGRLAAGGIAVAAMIGAAIAFLSVNTAPKAAPRPPQAQRLSAQATDLKGRVGNSKYFTGCSAPAQAAPGAEATVNCKARQPGITVSASSFKLSSQDFGFSPSIIPSESNGLNTYLKATIPNSLPVFSNNAATCSPNGGTTCPSVGFSGYWGSPNLIIGRIYCYEQSGSDYYIVWTFDNDAYETSHQEDFVVVASGRNLSALVNWWNQTPV